MVPPDGMAPLWVFKYSYSYPCSPLFLINIDPVHRPRRIVVYTTAPTAPDSLCFLRKNASWVQCCWKFICGGADLSRIPSPKKTRLAATPQIPYVFSSRTRLGFNAAVNLWCGQPLPDYQFFSKENALAIPRGHCHCKFLFVPKPGNQNAKCWQRSIVKAMSGHLIPNSSQTMCRSCEEGDVRLCDSQFFKACHSAPKGWDVKGGIPQNACWRLGGAWRWWSAPNAETR